MSHDNPMEPLAAFEDILHKFEGNHNRFNWIGERRFANSDAAHPYRDVHNCFAAISANSQKEHAMKRYVTKENRDASTFNLFIESLVISGWLLPNDVLFMNNLKIHKEGDAERLQDLLWDYKIDGKPLRVLVLYLPMVAPELNPIKLCYDIIIKRSKMLRRRIESEQSRPVSDIECACSVMDCFDVTEVVEIARQCGYRL